MIAKNTRVGAIISTIRGARNATCINRLTSRLRDGEIPQLPSRTSSLPALVRFALRARDGQHYTSLIGAPDGREIPFRLDADGTRRAELGLIGELAMVIMSCKR